ncbi:MAG: DUF1800 domain-containing protein, partial [Pseudomonadota bacterium]|nr:DUF1800 domain-containing protein [Pseudomonadota bacterium]
AAAASASGTSPTVNNTAYAASRFLTQATFGPTAAEITRLGSMSYTAWLDDQFARPQALHRDYMNLAAADLAATGGSISPTNFFDSYWTQAVSGNDQLRQRAAFALSQIFVVSFTDGTLRNQPRGVASYYDTLGANAFGNFRDLLEAVALHPMMGVYLTWLKNEKEDPATGRVPDHNFAREVTQLFTIGQYKLNLDGSVMTGGDGKGVAAYGPADLDGMAQVLTGYSWYAGTNLTDRTSSRFFGNNPNVERDWRPMQEYNAYASGTDFHSINAKNFLGVTIPAQTPSTADPKGDLKVMLDTLFNHPNVGPFIGRQLIQRLVTSNPSPQYTARVAAAFNDNGSGVRGDMKAVWKAILLDPEARAVTASTTAGKVREPVVRLANFLRAFNATSVSGRYQGIGNTDDPTSRLNQTPMYSPTVFNFYRPGYVPTSPAIAAAGLVVPEFQLVHDVSVAGYMNYMLSLVPIDANRDIQQDYSAEIALAPTPDALVERMNLLLFYGQMPDALRAQIVGAVNSRTVPAPVYASSSTAGGTLTKLADEGGTFTVTGSGTVRYGAGTTFVEKTVSGAGQCSNDFFGTDPVIGTGKACFLFVPTPSAASAASAPPATAANQGAIDAALRDRVYLAVFLSLAAPDYLIQK